MCNLETEGTKHGCGHYIPTKRTARIDCERTNCEKSRSHPPNCTDTRCIQNYGPDRRETITRQTSSYCDHCNYWYKGAGSRPR